MRKFPGRGGGKRCAEAFGVSPQQWSPWESGKRTPDELRLEQIATFFGATVEWFRRDHRGEQDGFAAAYGYEGGGGVIKSQTFTGVVPPKHFNPAHDVNEEDDINHYLWVVDILTRRLTANGIKIVVTFEKNATALTHA